MKSMQRKFGGLMKRSEDEADIQTVLAEFKAADDVLDFLVKELKAWRNGWDDILKFQYDATEAFATLYKSIEPTQDAEMTHQPVETPHRYMQKCLALQKVYSDSKEDLQQEIGMINDKLIRVVEDAKLHSKPLKKTIKHRDNMKLDYERFNGRVEHARKKEGRSAKDEANLAKQETDLAQARINYQSADDHVRETFPPVIEAIHALLPIVLANMIKLQTTLVSQLYTVLDGYTRVQRMPNPAPNNSEITEAWEHEFTSFRKELESGIQMIATGKTVHMAMTLPETPNTISGLGIRSKIMNRKSSNQNSITQGASVSPRNSISQLEEEEEEDAPPPRPPRPAGLTSPSVAPSIPSGKPRIPSTSLAVPGHPPPPYDNKPSAQTPSWPNQSSPWTDQQSNGGATPPSHYATPVNGGSPLPSISNASGDYFHARRTSTASSIASAAAASVAAKKKPPPPVPAKRLPSSTVQYVTALYDFEGQSQGDLAFREGDRIKVIKRTGSTDDWWEGELRGLRGSFPANYVQA